MKIREGLEIDGERLAEICRRYHVAELSLFGSVLGDEFGPDSDVDLLYVLDPDAELGWAIVDLHRELEDLFGRKVDLVSKRWLHRFLRDQVLASAQPLHVAA
jgi:predicted nucleotidyltransferase